MLQVNNTTIKVKGGIERAGGGGEELGWSSRVTVPNGNSSPGSTRISIWPRREPQFAGKPKPVTLSWKLI